MDKKEDTDYLGKVIFLCKYLLSGRRGHRYIYYSVIDKFGNSKIAIQRL